MLGLVLEKSLRKTKANKDYLKVTVRDKENVNTCMVWDNSEAFKVLRNLDCEGKVISFNAYDNEYNGQKSLVMTDCHLVEDADVSDFLETKYDVEAFYGSLRNLIHNWLSDEAYGIVTEVLDEHKDALLVEFAAKSHHDNCKGGLLAHTYKVCSLMAYVLQMYLGVQPHTKDADLYMMSAVFHDIGKIREMHLGVYQPESIVTHCYLGVEMLPKDKIMEIYDEKFWLSLVSAMLQHHGEFGDRCKSVVAYVTHRVDYLDSSLTELKQHLDAGDEVVSIDGFYLKELM